MDREAAKKEFSKFLTDESLNSDQINFVNNIIDYVVKNGSIVKKVLQEFPFNKKGGGTVMIWDEGFWEPFDDVEEGLNKGELKFKLNGKRLIGNWVLIKWNPKFDKKKNHWLLIKEKDEYVNEDIDISEFNTSIRTGRTMLEIKNIEKT